MDNVILTSNGFANHEITKEVVGYFGEGIFEKRAAIISMGPEDATKSDFALLIHSHLSDMKFEEVIFFDTRRRYVRELLDYDLIFIDGGNVYVLLDWVQRNNIKTILKEFFLGGGLFLGAGAGSMVMGLTVEVLDYVGGDERMLTLKDRSGLGIIKKVILPHYTSEMEGLVAKYEKATRIKVIRLSDGMAIVGKYGGDFYLMGGAKQRI
jgi:dipeptidase E